MRRARVTCARRMEGNTRPDPLYAYAARGTSARMRRQDDLDSPFAPETDSLPERSSSSAGPSWKIAIVDDEQEVHDVTVLALQNVSFCDRQLQFLSARSAREARALLAENMDVALVLLDVVMESDDAGLALVRYIRESLGNEQVRVVLRTGQPGHAPESAVIRNFDISDYRTKTELTSTRLFTTVIAALRTYQHLRDVTAQREELARLYAEQKVAFEEIAELKSALERERDYLREEVREAEGGGVVIGSSASFEQVLAHVRAVAPTDSTVLVLGESGVGKELVARAIHEHSARDGGPLVKVNCASIPRELFESEFFGHVKGAFTGALKDRVGRFELADGGTLFLDEIGEIPLDLQGKLLRALQEREFERVGATCSQRVDVRLVAATNRDLKASVGDGSFRADLYYRLHVFPITIPPLRERSSDIVPLFEHFVARVCAKLKRPFLKVTPETACALESYPWPGNVRELENVAERAVILSTDGVLRLDAALPELSARDALSSPAQSPVALDGGFENRSASLFPGRGFYTAEELRELERKNLVAALERANGRVSGEGGAADLLGIKPTTLSYQLKAFGITRRP
jgi:transcriptional regulator with GAF, ATPase, and Fis domain/CheY-like chemotaxis protein